MAWTVIYGLTFATFLTLIVVPSMYWLTFRIRIGVRNLLPSGSEKKATNQEEVAVAK